MKSFRLAMFFFLFVSAIKAQTYVPFPTTQDSVAWKETTSIRGDEGEPNYVNYHYKYLIGDTIIDSLNYSIIYASRVAFANNKGYIVGYIREYNKKIYYLENENFSTEDLLYDFNLQIGDTLKRSLHYPKICTSIDSILLDNNEYRKRYFFNYETEIVEGIGTIGIISGGIVQFEGDAFLDQSYDLDCVFQKDTILLKFNNHNDCFTIDSTLSIIESSDLNSYIYPNPVKDFLYINEDLRNTYLMVYSSLGEMVLEIKNFTSNALDISKLEKGMYILKLTGQKNGFAKFVKE